MEFSVGREWRCHHSVCTRGYLGMGTSMQRNIYSIPRAVIQMFALGSLGSCGEATLPGKKGREARVGPF